MKKLMVVATLAFAAAFANAASFDWSASKVINSSKTGYSAGTVARLFTVESITVADMAAKLAVGDFSAWTSKGYLEKTTTTSGGISADSYGGSATAGTYNWYAVFLDSSDTEGATEFYITATIEKAITDGAGNETLIAIGNQQTASMKTGAWQSINVPEPTSGLLLLLGMAGLALRRRRA